MKVRQELCGFACAILDPIIQPHRFLQSALARGAARL
jgi:hypothetical protein